MTIAIAGNFIILGLSAAIATLFWFTTRKMKRAKTPARFIAFGLYCIALSTLPHSFSLMDESATGFFARYGELLAYAGYTVSMLLVFFGMARWTPLMRRLDEEVDAREAAEARLQIKLERGRAFNAGLEALGRDHIEQGWDATTLMKEATRRVAELLQVSKVGVWRLDDKSCAIECLCFYDAASGKHTGGDTVTCEDNPDYFNIILNGKTLCLSDARRDPVMAGFGEDFLNRHGERALLDAPIRTGRGVRGILCCEHSGSTRQWSAEEASFVSAVAQYVAVAHLADSAETLASQLRTALRTAQSANTAKSAFVANMSHELRTPLNGVLGMAQALAMNGDLNPDQQAGVDTILSSGQQLLGVLNDVLDLAKIEAGRLELAPEAASLTEVLSTCCALFEPAAQAKGLAFESRVKDLPARLEFDPVRVRQCISNLVSNAVKFTDEGAVVIETSARPEDNGCWRVTIKVSDTGCGIDADMQARLFERFSQADNTSARRFGGTGLGLSITRELAQRMGGGVSVSSEPGRGSVFTLTFLARATQALQAPEREADDSLSALQGARILLVDDNEVNRIVARSFLEPSGVQVVEAESGEEALARFSEQAFDLVLLDAHMPKMNGEETLRRLRARERGGLPVIALTADAMSGDEARYRAMGMDGYVPKPIDRDYLLQACAKLIMNAGETVQRSASA